MVRMRFILFFIFAMMVQNVNVRADELTLDKYLGSWLAETKKGPVVVKLYKRNNKVFGDAVLLKEQNGKN